MWYNLRMLTQDIYDVLKPCLWGAMVESLDIKEDGFLIIERLLEHGGDKQANRMGRGQKVFYKYGF